MSLEEVGRVRWFPRELIRKVGDGRSSFFWKDAWDSSVPLRESFPRAFFPYRLLKMGCGDLWDMNAEGVRWRLYWRRLELFEWEKERLLELLGRLEGVVLRYWADIWVWKPDKEGVFSVNSCYFLLQNLRLLEDRLSYEEEVIFRELWKSKAPAKVLAFSWTLFLDRIPTMVNLGKRRLLRVEDSKRCVFCGCQDETVVHLFLHCDVISKV
ncbi:putative reverse transcriptase zinc-binding domain-containing protein [Medicago truncatula]|uniref:Putative reverse transcriptase zinc-binding domain-containing protein n=1 Tax=Medicago truncatula TaxID=3880 RepID=A0A396GFZ0_MEDTR|nr:putative reverse transcriptase zinc-binding domain-containing protein [Medicago truncatula]